MNREEARKISAVLEGSIKGLAESLVVAKDAMRRDEYEAFTRHVGLAIGKISNDLLDPIYEDYPDLAPPGLGFDSDEAIGEDDPPLTEGENLLVAQLSHEVVAKIDEALLAEASPQWRKVARIVGGMMSSFPNRPEGIPDLFYAQRVALLVKSGLLESQGNLRRMRFSEVRLPHQ